MICVICQKEFVNAWYIPRMMCPSCECQYDKSHVSCPRCTDGM